jgi:hypothetical protein
VSGLAGDEVENFGVGGFLEDFKMGEGVDTEGLPPCFFAFTATKA